MTQDEIIEMVIQAEILAKGEEWVFDMSNDFELTANQKQLKAFAKLVAAKERESWPTEMEAMERQVNILTDELAKAVKAEREACAKVCDERAASHPLGSDEQCEAEDCAEAIRARGEA